MATGSGTVDSGDSGIGLSIAFGAAETCSLERDTSGGFGSAVVIATLLGGTQDYIDWLPMDGVTYYYRAAVSRAGFTTSSYSSSVSSTPGPVAY